MAPGRPFTRETTICEWEEGKGQVGLGTEQPALVEGVSGAGWVQPTPFCESVRTNLCNPVGWEEVNLFSAEPSLSDDWISSLTISFGLNEYLVTKN